eukprot:TRINITY_DN8743_c1_g1_i1.p1 TRINITY_DN8743_c1_g1~~TRINITY_DN8743_c1_g1_i1.p1  ORF type:complete len:533 (+),score=143.61 TRINITY_DN8743_c1_g1_i1:2-1600(+)
MKRLAVKESKLNELASVISELQNTNEMLKSQAGETQIRPEILAAMESDKVAASRAMQQNNKMKQEIEELQKELINLINSKAEALDQLEDYKRRVDKLGAADSEIRALQEAVNEREGTIAGLRNQIRYLESQLNNHRDEESDSKSDVMPSTQGGKELEDALNTIRSLNSINSELRSQLEVLSSQTREGSESRTQTGTPGTPTITPSGPPDLNLNESRPVRHPSATSSSCDMEQSTSSSSTSTSESFVEVSSSDQQILEDDKSIQVELNGLDNNSIMKDSEPEKTSSGPHINNLPATPVSNGVLGADAVASPAINLETWKKLEERFISAMNRVAALSSDKEQLEHLVARLQDETDTITDYIIMYQHQRKQQKLRLQEKEDQLQQLARDKSNLQSKLEGLHDLVEQLLHSHQAQEGTFENATNGEIVTESGSVGEPSENGAASATQHENDEVTKASEKEGGENQTEVGEDKNKPDSPTTSKNESGVSSIASKKEDAKKIYKLLSEIQAESKQMVSTVENFQPWFFDSTNSKVITV